MTTPRTTTTLAPSAPLSAPPPPSALKSAARSRGSSRGAFGSSAKRKRVVWSEGVEDGESPARADDGTREGGTGADDGGAPTATGFGPGRRSSSAAAAARRRPPGFAWTTRRGRNCRSTFAPNSWARVGNPREVRKGGTDFLAAWDHPPRGAGFSRSAKRRRSLPPDPTRGESEAPIPRRRVLRCGFEAPASEAPGSEAPGPGPGSGSAASAFARHLGMRREAEADEGRLRRAGEMADDVSRAGEMAEDVSRAELDSDPDPEPGPGPSEPGASEPAASEPGASDPDADGGFPSTYSQIDPDVLEAIGRTSDGAFARTTTMRRDDREVTTRPGRRRQKDGERARERRARGEPSRADVLREPHRDGAGGSRRATSITSPPPATTTRTTRRRLGEAPRHTRRRRSASTATTPSTDSCRARDVRGSSRGTTRCARTRTRRRWGRRRIFSRTRVWRLRSAHVEGRRD